MRIVPTNRLLLWTGLVVPPTALLLAAEPAWAMPLVFGTAVFLLCAIVDALLARDVMTGIALSFPAVVRISKDRELRLEITVQNTRMRKRGLRIALGMPESFKAAREDLRVELPAGAARSRTTWVCRPRERGRFLIERAAMESQSPLGFWHARRDVQTQCEVRVYPNLFSDRKTLAGVLLNKGVAGAHSQRQLGKGKEFEKLREYVPGDGYDEIHWKATARRGRPITKVFQIERTQDIYVIIDASRLSVRRVEGATENAGDGDYPDSVLERFITAALVLAQTAERQGDRFGLLVFSNKIEKFVRAGNGKAHYSACRDALFMIEPRVVSPDYNEVATFLRTRVRRRALVIFLTSLDDPVLAEGFSRTADLLRKQHLVLVNMIQPPGISPIFSEASNTVDELFQRLGGHMIWSDLRHLQKALQSHGVRFSLLKNERLAPELVGQYLGVKKSQAL